MPVKLNPFSGKLQLVNPATVIPVQSVVGTANRITVTAGVNPQIDIAANYVGQTSLTTLGTITTGVWNATIVAPAYGGTGVNNDSNTLTLAGNLATSGAFATTLTTTGATNVTLPTSGTLLNVATKITTYLANGSWTIDPRTKFVDFYGWGGGGGGGSGRCGVSNAAGGGSSGAGGNFIYLRTLAINLTGSPYTVTIGTGGSGGLSVNAVTTNGNPGNPGNPSSVGTIIIASGGLGGSGGTTGNVSGATSLYYYGNALLSSYNSASGAITIGSTPNALVVGWDTSGGGGSGYTSATARIGGVGGAITDLGGNVLLAGGLAGDNTGATAGNGNSPTSSLQMIGGTGGGGGGQDGVITSGTGGNGAQPGGAGGGGAGNLNSNPSGAGGQGGSGQIIIIEYF